MATAFGAELMTLAGLAVSGAFILIVMRPQFGAYLYLLTCPLIVGIARGDTISSLRPNEMLLILVVGAVAVRTSFSMLARIPLKTSVSRVDLALFLLAFTSSVVPLLLRSFRDLPISADDVLYSTVLWKYLILYWAVRLSISTPSQVAHCLWFSMTSAALTGVIAILQVGDLFGIPEFLHRYYGQPFEGTTTPLTDRATSTIASAFGLGDLMIMNLVIALALLRVKQGRRWILMAASAVFLSGCIAAGEFSGIIGLVVAGLVFGVLSERPFRILTIGLPTLIIAAAALWPVVSTRLAGFEERSGMPHSWQGRWKNLQDYFFPQLFSSSSNWLLGVRPAPRLPAHETWREMVYLESGYVWLLWIGGIPLLAAFGFFAWVSGQHFWQVIHERTDAVGAAATAGFAFLIALLALMVLDPHLTLRGSADLFFPLLALSSVQSRSPKEYWAERRNARPRALIP